MSEKCRMNCVVEENFEFGDSVKNEREEAIAIFSIFCCACLSELGIYFVRLV